MRLEDIAAALGVSKPTASRLARGIYDRGETELPARYAALIRLVEAERREATEAATGRLCFECPREDCAGCRVAELTIDL